MSIAVSKLVEDHLKPLINARQIPPGHLFQLYFGGWWTWEADATIRREELGKKKRKIEDERRRIETRTTRGSRGQAQERLTDQLRDCEARLKACQELLEAVEDNTPHLTKRVEAYARTFGIGQRFPFDKTVDACEKEARDHIEKVNCKTLAKIRGCGLLEALIGRQKTAAGLLKDVWSREKKLSSPLVTGIGREHPTENGFAFLEPYGLPYLPGSAVKGVLRRSAEELALFEVDSKGWTLPAVWWLFGFDATASYFPDHTPVQGPVKQWADAAIDHAGKLDENKTCRNSMLSFLKTALGKEVFDKTFGNCSCKDAFGKLQADKGLRRSIHVRGSLHFWDVFPDLEGGKVRIDILNPHHKSYYEGKPGAVPGTFENPTPHFFLVVPAGSKLGFMAVLDCLGSLPQEVKKHWRALLNAALDHAGMWLGFGAKTSVGYGRLTG